MPVQPCSERHGWCKAQGCGNNLLPPRGWVLPIPDYLLYQEIGAAGQAIAQGQDGRSCDQVGCGADYVVSCFLHYASPCGAIARSIGKKLVFVNLMACYILP